MSVTDEKFANYKIGLSWIKFSAYILYLISTIHDDTMLTKGISHDEKSSIDKKPEASFPGTNKGLKQKLVS